MKHIVFKNREEEIIIPIPQNYSDCIILIRSDFYRYTGKRMSLFKMYLKSFRHSSLALSFWLRLSSYKGILYYYTRVRLFFVTKKYGLQISPNTRIGYGLYIGHGFGTIVNSTAVIGNNVNLSQFSTIGSNKNKAATIGDNVYIGPSVCIVENVSIGSNASIGAGSVVVKDVPKNCTVAGVPARVISEKEPGRFVGNRWPLP